jgi:hypothetical protein
MPEVAPEEQLRELLGQLGQRLKLLYRRLPAFRVAGAERRCNHLLEQAGFPVGGRAERTQVPGRDAEARELGAGDRDVHVPGRVELVATGAPRLQQPVFLELPRQVRRDGSPIAELPEVELVVRIGQPDGTAPPSLLPGPGRRRELLADHSKR